VARTVICSLLGVAAVALTSCGGDSTASKTVADTDTITILQTDIEAQPMGEGQACIEKLTKLVTVDYLSGHDVPVEDEASAAIPIQNAIVNVCEIGPPDQIVHEAAHEVVHSVEDELAGH
jgi:hypothetical protein